MNAPVDLLVVVILAAVAFSALLSAGEGAVSRISRADVAALGVHRRQVADRVEALLDPEETTLAAIAYARVVAEIVAAAGLTLALVDTSLPWWAVLVLVVVGAGMLALVVVRLGPRSLGRRQPVAVLTALAGMLTVIRPIGALLPAVVREDDLEDIVERIDESEVIEDDEREMFRSVLELGDTLTREVMVPRTDMVTIESTTTLRKALSLFLRSGYSRVPVIGASVDELRGILYLKDVVRRLHTVPDSDHDAVAGLARPAEFVPESKPVDDLLREMQGGAFHIAMVVDEYGGIAGLVTIEDALEEIVGELTDEHDHSGPEVEDLGDGVLRVPARLATDELGELFDVEVDDDDVDSAGGLLAKALGKVPLPGSSAQVGELRLEAERVEGRRKQVATLLVSRVPAPPQPEEDR